MSELYKEIPLLDLENNKNLKKEDILFLELNQIMEQINDLINNVDFNLEKNLEQHLEKFKNENNLDGLSEEEKIFEFIKFVDKQEYDYFNDLKKNFIQKIEIVLKNQDRIGSKLIDLIQSQEELEKKDLSNNWLKNQIKNVKKLFIESDFKNIEIYKFKNTNLDLITAKLNRLKYSINQINKEVNTIDFELIKKSLSNYNKAYTLDSFVKENPLFQKKFNYLNIKPYNEEFKEVLNKYKKEIEKIEKDIDLNVSKKFDLLSKRLTVNLTHEMIMKSLNKSILKPICLVKYPLLKKI